MNTSTFAPTYQPFGEGAVETTRRRYGRSSSTSKIGEFPSSSSLPKGASRKKEKMAVSSSLHPTRNWSSQEFDVSVCIYCMKQGTPLTKIKAQGTKSIRTYFLDEQNSCIRWKPTRKGTKAKIAVDCIKEVREGQNTDSFKRSLVNENVDSTCCFSIIYGNGLETLDLVACTKQEACIWIQGVRFLLASLQMEDVLVKSNRLRDNWLRTTFETADKSKNGLLDMDEVIKLLHKLNFKLSKRKIKTLFKEADTNTVGQHEGQLDYEEFMQFYKLISTRKELLFLLQQYGKSKQFMTAEELQKFLGVEQKMESVTIEMCEDIIETFEPVPENMQNKWLGIDGFTKYLLSPEGNAFNQNHTKVHQDMTRPLSHYYMAASHNTYLIGDQLMSQSSVDIYACVLQSGCRCVELDCWDGKDGEPVIYHGYTLTTKILFREVIETINKYAFLNNPYPVVLSIENHCSVDQQKKMAQYLGEILRDKLHATPPSEEQTQLPSPEDLKEKILIKTKKLPMTVEEDTETGEVTDEDSADEMEDNFKLEKSNHSKQLESIAMAQLALMQKKPISPGRKAWQVLASKVKGQLVGQKHNDDDEEHFDSQSKNRSKTPQRTKKKKRSNRTFSSMDSGIGSEKARDDSQDAANCFREGLESRSRNGSKKKIVLSKMLSDLVVYTKSSSFSGFKSAPFWELPSMGEMRAMNLCTVHASQVVRFTCTNLCRVYPSAYRIDSSNYNPTPMWNAGIQIVALNYQTEGRAMQQCNAKFSYNGQCGYVLKPEYLCHKETVFDPNCQGPLPHLQKKLLTLQVISGQQLPKPPQSLLGERGEIIDPFVEVEVIGLPIDTAKMVTKTIQDNGFSPIWNSTMQFGIQATDLALIRFAVWDEDPIGRDFIGQSTLPVSSLMSGYRHIHLDGLDQATLFVHISITDFDEMSIKHLKITPTKQYNRSKSAEDSGMQVQTTFNRKQPLGRMFSSRRRHSISAIFNRPKSLSGPFENSQDDDLRSKETNVLEVMLDSEDETAVSNNLILEQIITSDLSTRLEEDGSVSIAINQIPFLFKTMSVSTLLTCIREGTLNIRINESNGGSKCRLLYQYAPLQRPMDLPISETDEGSIRSWWNNLLQDMSEQYRNNSIASTLMQSIDANDSSSSSSSESSDEISFLSDLSDIFIQGSEVTSSGGIESLHRQDPEGGSSLSFQSQDNIQNPTFIGLSKSEDGLSADLDDWHRSTFSNSGYHSASNVSDIKFNCDRDSQMSLSVVQELCNLSRKYKLLQNQVTSICAYPSHLGQNIDLKSDRVVGDEYKCSCKTAITQDLLPNEKDILSEQCDDTISCISVPYNNDGEFDTLDSRREEKPKVGNDVMSLECDDVISDISCSDYESDGASTDNSMTLNISEASIPSASFSEGAITGDLDFEGHYNLSRPRSTNKSSNSIPEYMMQRFVTQGVLTRKQRLSRYRNPYSNRLPEYRIGKSSSASSEILCDTNQTCIKLLTPPPVKLRRSLSDRIITSSKVPFSSSVSSTLCEELMMTSEQETPKVKLPHSDNFINLNSNNNNNDGCDESDENPTDKDGIGLSDNGDVPAQTVNCADGSNSQRAGASSLKPDTQHNSKTEPITAMTPIISIDVTKDDPLWQSSDDDQDTSDSSSNSSSDNTILEITLEELGKKSEAMGAPGDVDSIEIGELKIKDIFGPEEYNFYKKCFLNRLHQAQKKRIHDARREGKKTSRNKMKRKELEKSRIKLNDKKTDECNSISNSVLNHGIHSDSRGNENAKSLTKEDVRTSPLVGDNCLLLNKHSKAVHEPFGAISQEKDENENSLVNNYERSTCRKRQDKQASAHGTAYVEQAPRNEGHDNIFPSPRSNERAESSWLSKRALIIHNPDTDYIQLHQMPDLLSNHTVEEEDQPVIENDGGSNEAVTVDETVIEPEQAPSVPFQLSHILRAHASSRPDIDYGDYVTLRFNSQGHRLPLDSDAEVKTSDEHIETGQGTFRIQFPKPSENIYEELSDVKGRKLQRAQSMMLPTAKAHRPRPIDFTLEKMFIESLNLEPGMMHDVSFEDPRFINVNKTLSSTTVEAKPIASSDRPGTVLSKSEFANNVNVDDTCVLNLRERSKQIIDVMAKVMSSSDRTSARQEHNQLHLNADIAHCKRINDTQDFSNECFGVDLAHHSAANQGAGSRRPVIIPEEDWGQSVGYLKGTQLLETNNESIQTITDPVHLEDPTQSDAYNDGKASAARLRVSDAQLRNRRWFHSSNLQQRVSNEQQRDSNIQPRMNSEQQHVINLQRVRNEPECVGIEQCRVSSELQHVSNKHQRVSNEKQHVGSVHQPVKTDMFAFSRSTYQNTLLAYRDDHPAAPSDTRENTQYRYHCQRFNESEEALLEYKPLRTNIDYVVFPQNHDYFREPTLKDNVYPHNYRNYRSIGAELFDDVARPVYDEWKAKDTIVDNTSDSMLPSLSTVNSTSRDFLNTNAKTGVRRDMIDMGNDPIMVDQAPSPGIGKHAYDIEYTTISTQRSNSEISMERNETQCGPSDVSNESTQDSNPEMRLTSTPTRSSTKMSEIRQWNLSAIESKYGTADGFDDVVSPLSSSSQTQISNELHVMYGKCDESSSPIYENLTLAHRSKQENNQNSMLTDHVDASEDDDSRITSTSLTISYDHTLSPSTIPTRDAPPDNHGIKRWFTNENVAVHKIILNGNDESEASLNISTTKTPPSYDKHINKTQLSAAEIKLASSVEFLPSYEDHLEKHGLPKHYSSTPSLNEDNDSVFLNDTDYDEETPLRPHFFRSTSQPEKARSSIIRNRSNSMPGIKRTKSVRFEVPGEENAHSPPSLHCEEIHSNNGESFSIIERLVGKQSYKEILEKSAQRNLSNEEDNGCNTDSISDEKTLPEECLQNQCKVEFTEDIDLQVYQRNSPLQRAIYALPNVSYNEYTEMADGVQIKEYADIGTQEMTRKTQSESPIFAKPRPASFHVDTRGMHVRECAKHYNGIDTPQSCDNIQTLSRYQMNYRGMVTSDFWKPIGSDEDTRHPSSSSSNMSIPSSTTDITYLTEFDRNDTRRGVIRRDAIPLHNNQVNSQRGIERSPPVMVEPPFNVISPDDMFKWTEDYNADYSPRNDEDRPQMSPDYQITRPRYTAGNFSTRFTVAKKQTQRIGLRAKDNGYRNSTGDVLKETRNTKVNFEHHKRHTKGENVLSKYKESLRISNLKNGLKHVFRKKGKKSDDDSSEQGSESSDNNQHLSRKKQDLILTLEEEHAVIGDRERLHGKSSSLHYGSRSGDGRASSFLLKTYQNEPLQKRHRSVSMPFVSSPESLEDVDSPHIYFSLNV